MIIQAIAGKYHLFFVRFSLSRRNGMIFPAKAGKERTIHDDGHAGPGKAFHPQQAGPAGQPPLCGEGRGVPLRPPGGLHPVRPGGRLREERRADAAVPGQGFPQGDAGRPALPGSRARGLPGQGAVDLAGGGLAVFLRLPGNEHGARRRLCRDSGAGGKSDRVYPGARAGQQRYASCRRDGFLAFLHALERPLAQGIPGRPVGPGTAVYGRRPADPPQERHPQVLRPGGKVPARGVAGGAESVPGRGILPEVAGETADRRGRPALEPAVGRVARHRHEHAGAGGSLRGAGSGGGDPAGAGRWNRAAAVYPVRGRASAGCGGPGRGRPEAPPGVHRAAGPDDVGPEADRGRLGIPVLLGDLYAGRETQVRLLRASGDIRRRVRRTGRTAGSS